MTTRDGIDGDLGIMIGASDAALHAPIIEDVEKGLERVKSLARQDTNRSLRIPDEVQEADEKENEQTKDLPQDGHEGDDDDEPPLPKNNLLLVMPALGLVAFISALDQSILSTALPTIAAEFNATPSQYSWIGTSYLLAQTLMTPINGRLTDIIGRKPALYASIMMLLVFSAMSGAAKSVEWLIIARAFAGIGGGSIVGLTLIVISDIVPLRKRGAFQGYMGAAWGSAGALGPILGGILTSKASWRWCFWINLPTCGIALVSLILTLNLNPTNGKVAELRRTFDFLGLLLILVGSALIILGFSTAADVGFSNPSAYGVITAGIVVCVMAIIHFMTTKRNAIIPARVFRTRTPLFFMIGSFLNSCMFMPVNFLLPQFFQGVQGVDTFQSGIDLVPFSVCAAIFGIIAGQITSRLHIVRPVVWTGFGITALSFGLFYRFFDPTVTYATQEILLALASAGIGLAISTPMLVIQASMPPKDMAATTSAWVLLRSLGATIGVAVFTAILNAGMRTRFAEIPGYETEFFYPEGTEGYRALHDLPEGEMKTEVLWAFADSFKTCWIIGCGLICAALTLTLFTKSYSIQHPKWSKHAETQPSTHPSIYPPIEEGKASPETKV